MRNTRLREIPNRGTTDDRDLDHSRHVRTCLEAINSVPLKHKDSLRATSSPVGSMSYKLSHKRRRVISASKNSKQSCSDQHMYAGQCILGSKIMFRTIVSDRILTQKYTAVFVDARHQHLASLFSG
uniref:Uncharacterized protein n=1 Tax=Rhodosorus marinus TaxID=101924 RepID=A0A7S0BL05_9RHOD